MFFFFNDTATTEIYTLSLHDALPIFDFRVLGKVHRGLIFARVWRHQRCPPEATPRPLDRKSTRLNSSHGYISYAVFCLKKKKIHTYPGSLHLTPSVREADYQYNVLQSTTERT